MSSDVSTLMEMGFTENGAKRALMKTGHRGVQVAMDWLFAHDSDPDLNDPVEEPKGHTLNDPTPPTSGTTVEQDQSGQKPDASESTGASNQSETTGAEQQAKSLKCDDCGKILKDMDAAEFHAVKSGHSNFSESTEEKKPLTAEEKAKEVTRLQEKMKQKRVEREAKDKQEQIDREKMRRLHGKDMVSAKAKFEEDEIRRAAELKRREKEEEKKARQKVREDIERDKRERAAKFAKSPEAASKPVVSAPAAATQPAAAQKEYKDARLQIRLPNGQALTQTFGGKEQLAAVRLYVQMNRTDGDASPFKLMMSFPKKVFTEADMEKPLCELGLVPSAVLIVSKAT